MMIWPLLLGVPVLLWLVQYGHENGKKNVPAPTLPSTPPPDPEPVQPKSFVPVSNPGVIASLDEEWSPHREQQILEAVREGLHDRIDFTYVVSMGRTGTPLEGYVAYIPVMRDSLKFEGVRTEGSYRTAQAIADLFGFQLMTPYVAGLVSAQADARLTPTIFSTATAAERSKMATKGRMIEASRAVDQKLAAAGFSPDSAKLVLNPGKDWVISIRNAEAGSHPVSGVPRSQAAVNHGLYKSAYNPIQKRGTFHTIDDTDYSQGLRFLGPKTWIFRPDGSRQELPTRPLVMNRTLAPLLTGERNRIYGHQVGEGVLPYDRHPAIPKLVA